MKLEKNGSLAAKIAGLLRRYNFLALTGSVAVHVQTGKPLSESIDEAHDIDILMVGRPAVRIARTVRDAECALASGLGKTITILTNQSHITRPTSQDDCRLARTEFGDVKVVKVDQMARWELENSRNIVTTAYAHNDPENVRKHLT